MFQDIWVTHEEGEVIPLRIEKGVFVLFHDRNSHAPSVGVVLGATDIPVIVRGGAEFGAALGQHFAGGAQLAFRLIGNPTHFDVLARTLVEQGYEAGNHYAMKSGGDLQFLPLEGRIRVEKVPANQVLAQPVASRKTRVLVVDDSKTIRMYLEQIISRSSELEFVGSVDRPSKAEAAIREFKPDVITLDIHMPEMTGVELTRKLVPQFGIPIVLISALSREDGTDVLDALEAGAVDYIQKPTSSDFAKVGPAICEKIQAARFAQVTKPVKQESVRHSQLLPVSWSGADFSYLITIGSSTGGTEALRAILTRLPENIPPICIVQHIPANFSAAFANRMNDLCPFEVKEAQDGDELTPNRVLIAPGGLQMRIVRSGSSLQAKIEDTEPVNRHKPSVDVMYDSILQLKLKNVLGIILTGMGADGARGLLSLRQAGARTIAQDEASCVVFGMPREAIARGAAEQVVSLDRIPFAMGEVLCGRNLKKAG